MHHALIAAMHIVGFNPYTYHTYSAHLHRWVWVDVSGNGWKSKVDAIRESLRLLRWLHSLGY
jgi:hypothetical protein